MDFQIEPIISTDIPTNIKRKLKGLGLNNIIVEPLIEGAIVTAYPLTLPMDIPVSKVLKLTDDLALAVGVDSVDIRREGNKIVIYVPNEERKIVGFFESLFWYLKDKKVKEMQLPLLLGINTKGDNAVIDLTLQPHLLIAGSTGSGKSIFEANIISSLAMLKDKEELEFCLVDTKRLDLTLFENLPSVKEMAKTIEEWHDLIHLLMLEVKKRNKKLEENKVRNLNEYNKLSDVKKLPYIILLIDELADLIDQDRAIRRSEGKIHANEKVEDELRRLIQICRASGIHVIACTQRTSVDIVSGLIKANFPSRIALKVASSMDSKVILDESGAENLLGNGDMLVKESINNEVKRFHAPFIKLDDIKQIIEQRDMIRQTISMGV